MVKGGNERGFLRASWLPLATDIICFPFHYKETNLSLQFACGLPSLFICQLRAVQRPHSKADPINTKNIMRLCNQTLSDDVYLADGLEKTKPPNPQTNKKTPTHRISALSGFLN